MKRNVLVILVFIFIVFFALGIVYTDIICGKWDAEKYCGNEVELRKMCVNLSQMYYIQRIM